jgi:hypothetical protein
VEILREAICISVQKLALLQHCIDALVLNLEDANSFVKFEYHVNVFSEAFDETLNNKEIVS